MPIHRAAKVTKVHEKEVGKQGPSLVVQAPAGSSFVVKAPQYSAPPEPGPLFKALQAVEQHCSTYACEELAVGDAEKAQQRPFLRHPPPCVFLPFLRRRGVDDGMFVVEQARRKLTAIRRGIDDLPQTLTDGLKRAGKHRHQRGEDVWEVHHVPAGTTEDTESTLSAADQSYASDIEEEEGPLSCVVTPITASRRSESPGISASALKLTAEEETVSHSQHRYSNEPTAVVRRSRSPAPGRRQSVYHHHHHHHHYREPPVQPKKEASRLTHMLTQNVPDAAHQPVPGTAYCVVPAAALPPLPISTTATCYKMSPLPKTISLPQRPVQYGSAVPPPAPELHQRTPPVGEEYQPLHPTPYQRDQPSSGYPYSQRGSATLAEPHEALTQPMQHLTAPLQEGSTPVFTSQSPTVYYHSVSEPTSIPAKPSMPQQAVDEQKAAAFSTYTPRSATWQTFQHSAVPTASQSAPQPMQQSSFATSRHAGEGQKDHSNDQVMYHSPEELNYGRETPNGQQPLQVVNIPSKLPDVTATKLVHQPQVYMFTLPTSHEAQVENLQGTEQGAVPVKPFQPQQDVYTSAAPQPNSSIIFNSGVEGYQPNAYLLTPVAVSNAKFPTAATPADRRDTAPHGTMTAVYPQPATPRNVTAVRGESAAPSTLNPSQSYFVVKHDQHRTTPSSYPATTAHSGRNTAYVVQQKEDETASSVDATLPGSGQPVARRETKRGNRQRAPSTPVVVIRKAHDSKERPAKPAVYRTAHNLKPTFTSALVNKVVTEDRQHKPFTRPSSLYRTQRASARPDTSSYHAAAIHAKPSVSPRRWEIIGPF